jgi:hypothetical protein
MFQMRALKGHPVFQIPILCLGLTLAGLAATLACASPLPNRAVRSTPLASPAGSEAAVYPSIDLAVEAALAATHEEAGPGVRDRLRIGTIRRVDGGFAWVEPVVSSSPVAAMTPMQVRLRLGPEDVAIYGLHPRSGLSDLDRANERITRSERRLVDEQDPLHRPIYVLTPSRRIVRYPEAGAESIEVVRQEAEGLRRR